MKQTAFIIKAAMPETLFIGVSSVCAGAALAVMESKVLGMEFNVIPLVLCLIFAVAAQLSANFIFVHNDLQNYYGSSDTEVLSNRLRRKEEPELYSRSQMLGGVSILFALTIGVVLISYSGLWAFLVGAILVILIYLAVQGPMPLLLTPFGLLVYYIVAGPLGVSGTFLMEFHDSSFTVLNWFDMVPVILMGVAMGFPAATARVAMEYEQYRQSLRIHRTSVVTELGRKGARILVLINGFAMWGTFWWMTDSSTYIYTWVDMIMPTIALIGNIGVWYRMAKYSPNSEGIKPAKLALINIMVLGLGTLLIYCFGGAPVSEGIPSI